MTVKNYLYTAATLLVHCGQFTRTLRPIYSYTPASLHYIDSAKPLLVVWDNGRGNAVVCGKRPNLLIFAQLRIHVKYIELVAEQTILLKLIFYKNSANFVDE